MNDTLNLSISNFTTKGPMIAFVMEANKRSKINHIKAYVPKLMSDLKMGTKLYEKAETIPTDIIKNNNFKLKPVKAESRNYIYLTAETSLGTEAKIVNLGQELTANFIGGDLKSGHFSTIIDIMEDTTKHVDTRYRQYVDNVEELTSPDGVEMDYYSDGNKEGIGNYNAILNGKSSDDSSTENINDTSSNNRGKKPDGKSKYKKASKETSGKTKSDKPKSNFYDMVMDSNNEVIAIRQGSKDAEGKNIGKEKIPSMVLDKKKNYGLFTNAKGKLEFKNDDIKVSSTDGKKITVTNKSSTIEVNNNDIVIKNPYSRIIVSNTTINMKSGSCNIFMNGDIVLSGPAGVVTLTQLVALLTHDHNYVGLPPGVSGITGGPNGV